MKDQIMNDINKKESTEKKAHHRPFGSLGRGRGYDPRKTCY